MGDKKYIVTNSRIGVKLIELGYLQHLCKMENGTYTFHYSEPLNKLYEELQVNLDTVFEQLEECIDSTVVEPVQSETVEPVETATEPTQTVKPEPEPTQEKPRLYEVYSPWVKNILVENGFKVVRTGVSFKTGNPTYLFDDTVEFRTLFNDVKSGKYLKNKKDKPVEQPVTNNVEDSPIVNSDLTVDEKRLLYVLCQSKRNEFTTLGIRDSDIYSKLDAVMGKLKVK